MKQIILLCTLGLALADKLDNTYLPPSNAASAGGNHLLSSPFQRNGGGPFQGSSKYSNAGPYSGSSSYGGSSAQIYENPNNVKYTSSNYNSPTSNGFNSFGKQGSGRFGNGPSSYTTGNQQSYSSYNQKPDNILRYNNENNGDGNYRFDYATENKISQKEIGHLQNAGTDREASVVQGDYSYISPEGKAISVQYIADENGFRASSGHTQPGFEGHSGNNAGFGASTSTNFGSTNKFNQPNQRNTFGSFGGQSGFSKGKSQFGSGQFGNSGGSASSGLGQSTFGNYGSESGFGKAQYGSSGQFGRSRSSGISQNNFGTFGTKHYSQGGQGSGYNRSGGSVGNQYLPPGGHGGY